MNPIAQQALSSLLKRAEDARLVEGKARDLVFSAASFPAYHEQRSLEALEELHATLERAEKEGAIAITWKARAGSRGQIERIRLVSDESLAAFLGVKPKWIHLENARRRLDAHVHLPQVQWMLDRWSRGYSPRGRGPADVEKFQSALQILEELSRRRVDRVEVSIRRLGVELFADSKAIYDLSVELDLLTGEPGARARPDREVFAHVGLVEYPLPLFVAGESVTFRKIDGTSEASRSPYDAIPPDDIACIEWDGSYLLTVENLTTFHELARGHAGNIKGLLLYCPGFPSPTWLRIYSATVASASTTRILHWGDSDLGGLRIAVKLADAARAAGATLELFGMGVPNAKVRKLLTDAEADHIVRECLSRNWNLLASYFRDYRGAVEQEGQPLQLPQS